MGALIKPFVLWPLSCPIFYCNVHRHVGRQLSHERDAIICQGISLKLYKVIAQRWPSENWSARLT